MSATGCWGQEGSTTVVINPSPATVSVYGGGTQCGGSMVLSASGAIGGTIYWQGTTSGGTSTAFPSFMQAVSSSGTYYFRAQSPDGCWGDEGGAIVYIYTLPDAVSILGGGTYCGSTNLTASGGAGGTIYWQGTTSGGTDISTPATLMTISTSGTYYFRAKSADGCWGQEGEAIVTINSLADNVAVTGGGTYCGTATLQATGGPNGTIYWQGITPNGTNESFPASSWDITTSGTYYFRERSADGCWGVQGSATVIINAAPTAVHVSVFGTGLNCGSATLTASGGLGGTIYWQATTSGGTSQALQATSKTVYTTGTYYFRAVSAEGCWGTEGSYSTTITPVPDAPTGNPIQYFCSGYSVSNIDVLGTDVKWYPTASSLNEITGGTTLVDGQHYFASQTIGGCTSTNRLEVEIHIAIPTAPTGNDSLWFCATDSPTVGNLIANGDNILWYESAAGGDALNTTDLLIDGVHYYASQSQFGCASPTRLDVAVSVNNLVPIKPISGGAASVCINSSTPAFTDATPNGVWSVIDGGGSASITTDGIVTGISAGSLMVKYTVASGSCSNFVTTLITVNPLPVVDAIAGSANACIGFTSLLTNTTAGGVWISNNPSVADINTSGLLTGNVLGTTSITYTVTDINSCVNSVNKEITVYPVYAFTEYHSICNRTIYNWHGQILAATGVYTAPYTTVYGCDSIYTLHLTVYPTYAVTELYTICEGETYLWHNQSLTSAGSYYANYFTTNGCDSTFTLHLSTNPKYAFDETLSICEGDILAWHGLNLSSNGTYTAPYTSVNGCDSVYTLNLTVNPVYTFNSYDTICEGGTLLWHGQNLTIPGAYTAHETNGNNCVDTYTLHLTVNPKYVFNENQSICGGTSLQWHNQILNAAGNYTASYLSRNGCDSIYNINITMNQKYAFSETQSICEGEMFGWQGQQLTSTGVYTVSYTSINGCDSVYIMTFTVNPKYAFDETHTICDGNTYVWHNHSLTHSGTYSQTYQTVAGCDSIYTLHLVVNPVYAFEENYSMNEGNTYAWQGQSFTTSGTYTIGYLTLNGCDSIYTLHLTIIPSTKTLTVKLFLEGLHAGSAIMNQAEDISGAKFAAGIADTIRVELHEANAPFGLAYSYPNLDLSTNGEITINTIPASITGLYYIVIKHRNSIETWSTDAIDFGVANPLTYDFTTTAANAYGNNLKLMSGVFTIFAGDANQDGIVDGSDMAAIDNSSTAVLVGYYPEDLNGDGIVDASDMAIIDNNSTAVVSTKKP